MKTHLTFIIENNLLCGDRMITPKSEAGIIQHHVIYLGWIERDYWIIENKDGIGVRLSTLEEFLDHGKTRITAFKRFTPTKRYSRNDLMNFSLSLIGNGYDLFKYNCEDFCNHVQHGKPESQQIKNALVALLVVVGFVILVKNKII